MRRPHRLRKFCICTYIPIYVFLLVYTGPDWSLGHKWVEDKFHFLPNFWKIAFKVIDIYFAITFFLIVPKTLLCHRIYVIFTRGFQALLKKSPIFWG